MKYGIQILIWMVLTTFYLAANELSIYSVSAQDKKAKLLGPDANLQLVVYNSDLQDMTREVVYTSAPDNLISISDSLVSSIFLIYIFIILYLVLG